MLSKTAVVAAGVSGTLFISYCIYFDRKRRNDPKFKQNLRDKRAKAACMEEQSKRNVSELPELNDYESVQKFFKQEMQLFDELFLQGDVENSIEHLSTALAICGEQSKLLEYLEAQLPPPVFGLLMQRLPIVSQRLLTTLAARQMQD